MKSTLWLLAAVVLLGAASPVQAQAFNRTADVLFGAGVSTPVSLFTHRPWLGLVAGLAAAGIDEGYNMHDSTIRLAPGTGAYHMSLMGAGSLAGYGLGKLELHLERKRARKIHDQQGGDYGLTNRGGEGS